MGTNKRIGIRDIEHLESESAIWDRDVRFHFMFLAALSGGTEGT